MNSENSGDDLRNPENISNPDVRMQYFCVQDGNQFRKITQEDRWKSISAYKLKPSVPTAIRNHYDTARNLYLYAWHVYRFHNVAEQHALASLELAVRIKLIENAIIKNTKNIPGLKGLLELAAKHNLISNDRLANRLTWAIDIAKNRVIAAAIEHMANNQTDSMEFPDSETVKISDAEFNYDWISNFVESLPATRNSYAHGSQMLHATVLRTFEIVSDLINQLYEPYES